MNLKATSFISKVSYAVSTNIVTLLISTLTILVLPKILGVEDYGLLQLYIFYCAYVGFLHFGFNDGIYLRFAGETYGEIDKKLFFSQFVVLCFSQLLFGLCLWIATNLLIDDIEKKFIWAMVSLSLIIVNIRIMLMYVVQATNRIKEYAITVFYDRIFFLILTSIYLLTGYTDYKIIILFDIVGKMVSLIYIMFKCKEIIMNKFLPKSRVIAEVKENISTGIKLMIANFSNILIVGNIRFGIERSWSVSVFGKVSLALSISNLLMIFINSLGIVIFPLLRREKISNLPNLFQVFKPILSTFLLMSLLLYYFLHEILAIWLPEYQDSFVYMAILFPIVVFEGKTGLLLNTFLKTLRKEKVILNINLVVVSLSVILMLAFTIFFKSLIISIYAITFLLILRCFLLEIYLSRSLKVDYKMSMVNEFIIVMIFILTNQFFNTNVSFILYLISLIINFIINRKTIITSFGVILNLFKK